MLESLQLSKWQKQFTHPDDEDETCSMQNVVVLENKKL